jgi:hypothetical protein
MKITLFDYTIPRDDLDRKRGRSGKKQAENKRIAGTFINECLHSSRDGVYWVGIQPIILQEETNY